MTRRARAAASLVALAALTTSGCGSFAGTATPGTTTAAVNNSATIDPSEWSDPVPHVEAILNEVDRKSADDVGRAVAEIACTWSPIVDLTETAALIRAAPLLTPDYAASLVEPARSASGAVFANASNARAVSIATAQQRSDIVDGPANTDTTRYLAYAVTWVWTDSSGATDVVDDPRVRTIYAVISRQPNNTWLVSDIDWDDQILDTAAASGSARD